MSGTQTFGFCGVGSTGLSWEGEEVDYLTQKEWCLQLRQRAALLSKPLLGVNAAALRPSGKGGPRAEDAAG